MSAPHLALVSEPEEEATPALTFDFDEAFQSKIGALVLRDTSFAQRSEGLLKPEYFTNEAEASLARVALDYYAVYKKAPDKSIVGRLLKEAIAAKKIRKDLVDDIKVAFGNFMRADISDREFVVDKVAEFARQRATEEAILQSVGYLEKGKFSEIEKVMKAALDVGSLDDDGGYDFFEEVEHRTTVRKEMAAGTLKKDGITTGHAELDRYLYHDGWGRKELSVIMAPAKGGKSLALGEFAMNASLAGYNVLYATLENSTRIVSDRMDANVSEILMKDLTSSPFKVEEAVKKLKAKAGLLKIHEYPTGTLKPSGLRRLVQRYASRGVKFDLIVVDYADIMAPEHRSDTDRFNTRDIYIDLRALAVEENAAVLTATQTNRDGAKATTAKATDVAEDFNKVRTADVFLSLSANEAEKAAGEARIFFAAMRNMEDGFTLRIKQDRSRMRFLKGVIGRE